MLFLKSQKLFIRDNVFGKNKRIFKLSQKNVCCFILIQVNVFGFGPNRLGYWDHYYDRDSGEENSLFRKTFVHDAEAELEVIKKLDSIGKIKTYRGSR